MELVLLLKHRVLEILLQIYKDIKGEEYEITDINSTV